jgi:acyl-CoA thioester hydrolase
MDDPLELGRVTDRRPPFRYSALTRVWFSDTDAQGVVYYGRYMPYFDLARTEYHRHLGRVHLGAVDFAMRATTVEYHAGARFDDLLEVFVRVERVGTTSITYDHAAYRVDDDDEGDTLMATAKATLVCIDLGERRAVPVPAAFRERIAQFEEALA